MIVPYLIYILTFFRDNNGLFSAKRLQEFVLAKSVCELIDFDFDPVLIKLSCADSADIEKIIIQGKNFNCIGKLIY